MPQPQQLPSNKHSPAHENASTAQTITSTEIAWLPGGNEGTACKRKTGAGRRTTTLPHQERAIQHEIHLTNKQPFRIPVRGYSEANKKVIGTDVPEMLANGIIESTSSPYNSPPVIQKKKDGTERFCIDFRKLNEITVDVSQALPVIHETLKDLGQAKIFSTNDLKSGYWQISLHPDLRKYTAFSTPDGEQYQFRVMPFGLKNAPATFQNLMKEVLGT